MLKNQELKGNIRVFCRVRPILPDDSAGAEPIVSYPTSAEALGRGIDLMQNGTTWLLVFLFVYIKLSYVALIHNYIKLIDTRFFAGQKYPFTFDKVFGHDTSQQDVFMEISQLVQSALDGYKVI